jgi:hypothetical protein
MFSTICRVPKGLPQRTQLKGWASFSVTASFARAPSKSRGMSSMASSGQVSAHRPHCTQLRSMNRRLGVSGESRSAASGQAPMHALHSVQVALSTASAPNGAPAASLISSTRRSRARCSIAKSRVVRFSAERLKLAGLPTVAAGCIAHTSSTFLKRPK